ncbi:hypothetical protein SASPL_109126 [Salvia splendens]|uniref:Histone-lysine N-methyltransferase SETMAR n=1 Tax=Salvia splendens TaxID=180675 RepID=A0A8X9A844_SALSN|nr:hypothetical protein SASPL_109126 [Salvia splendens]
MEEPHCRKINYHRTGEPFFQCAPIVIPYLNPTELVSISSTCKTLHHLSTNVTSRRTSDASRGLEKLPIPFHNPIPGDPHTYSYFLYTPSQTLRTTTHFRQPWGSDHDAPPDPPSLFLFRVDGATGCDCTKGYGGDDFCPCLNLECGPSCKCDSLCGNRATQCGVNLRLKIVKHEKKAWGLYAVELISAGRFICEYAGEEGGVAGDVFAEGPGDSVRGGLGGAESCKLQDLGPGQSEWIQQLKHEGMIIRKDNAYPQTR